MLKCTVCGHEFQPVIENHYVSRDCSESGIVTAFKSNEVKHYDSFDCPSCGCQSTPQERKRRIHEVTAYFGEREEDKDETREEAEAN